MKLLRKFTTIALTFAMIFSLANAQVKAEKTITTSIENAEMRDGTLFFNSMAAGAVDGVYGARITFIVADESAGFGGSIIFNSSNGGWNTAEWGNDGAGKAISAVATDNPGEFTLTRTSTDPLFDGESGWAEVCLQSWWGSDLEVTKVEVLDADGNDLLAGVSTPAEETTATDETTGEDTSVAEESTAETTEAADTAITTDTTPKTGDSTNSYILLTIMGLAAIVLVSEKYLRKVKHS